MTTVDQWQSRDTARRQCAGIGNDKQQHDCSIGDTRSKCKVIVFSKTMPWVRTNTTHLNRIVDDRRLDVQCTHRVVGDNVKRQRGRHT